MVPLPIKTENGTQPPVGPGLLPGGNSTGSSEAGPPLIHGPYWTFIFWNRTTELAALRSMKEVKWLHSRPRPPQHAEPKKTTLLPPTATSVSPWRPALVLSWLVPLIETHASCFPSPLEPCWVTHWSTARSELLMLIPGPSSQNHARSASGAFWWLRTDQPAEAPVLSKPCVFLMIAMSWGPC